MTPQIFFWSLFVEILISVSVLAAPPTVAPPAPLPFIATLDLRPSWTTNTGEFHTENYVEVGYQFDPKTTLLYEQDFFTNLYDPVGSGGLGLLALDGFFRLKRSRLWVDKERAFSLGYEARVLLPTRAKFRNAGMITHFRNYLKLGVGLSKTVTMTLMEIPIFLFYNRAGSGNEANPSYENRLYFITDVTLWNGKITVSLPILFHSTRYRDYQLGAKNNATWSHFLWFYPEALYSLTPNSAVGLSFYTDNLAKADLSGLTLGDGFAAGVFQLVFRLFL